jgi:hypothetical protein
LVFIGVNPWFRLNVIRIASKRRPAMSDVPIGIQDLGDRVAEYGSNTRTQKLSYVIGGIFAGVGAAIVLLGLILSLVQSDAEQLCYSGIGLVVAAPGLFIIGGAWLRRDLCVQVFADGLTRTQRGKTDVIPWDDVTAFWYSVTHHQQSGRTASTAHVYTVQRGDERKFVFKDTLANVEKLGQTIRNETVRRLLPRAIEDMNAGQTVPFGKLAISKEGITRGTETVPWDEVTNVRLSKGVVYVEREGKRANWATVTVAETPNVFVLIALVNQIVGINKK